MEHLKLEVLSVITEITKRIVLENRYVENMIDDNKTHGYYIVKWYRPSHKFQEGTDILQSGGVVFNATYQNSIQQSYHW